MSTVCCYRVAACVTVYWLYYFTWFVFHVSSEWHMTQCLRILVISSLKFFTFTVLYNITDNVLLNYGENKLEPICIYSGPWTCSFVYPIILSNLVSISGITCCFLFFGWSEHLQIFNTPTDQSNMLGKTTLKTNHTNKYKCICYSSQFLTFFTVLFIVRLFIIQHFFSVTPWNYWRHISRNILIALLSKCSLFFHKSLLT